MKPARESDGAPTSRKKLNRSAAEVRYMRTLDTVHNNHNEIQTERLLNVAIGVVRIGASEKVLLPALR